MASKEKERWQFEQFCDAIRRPELKAAVDCEEPDFLFGEPPELGIELADLFADQAKKGGSEIFKNERKFDPFQSAVEAELVRLHPGIGISINLVRKDGSMGGKADQAPAIMAAVEIIERALPDLPSDTLVTVWERWRDQTNPAAAFVEKIQAYKHASESITKPLSHAIITGWALDHITDPIADLIREKERLRAERYVRKCPRSWLVLVASGASGAAFIDDEFDASGTPPTGFEKVFLFDQFEQRPILLQGEKAASAKA